VVERFAGQAGEQFSFELRFPDDFPLVHADYERTREVLENLVSNAVKYSPDGGVIRIFGRAAADHAIISVNDQGIGIAPEEQAKLFRRFYRVDNRLRRDTQGAGLGLFLARAIVEAQGGRIWVESAPGRGSRFSLTVPLATPRLVDLEGDGSQAPGEAEVSLATPRSVDPEGDGSPEMEDDSAPLATQRLVDPDGDEVEQSLSAKDKRRITVGDTAAQAGEDP